MSGTLYTTSGLAFLPVEGRLYAQKHGEVLLIIGWLFNVATPGQPMDVVTPEGSFCVTETEGIFEVGVNDAGEECLRLVSHQRGDMEHGALPRVDYAPIPGERAYRVPVLAARLLKFGSEDDLIATREALKAEMERREESRAQEEENGQR